MLTEISTPSGAFHLPWTWSSPTEFQWLLHFLLPLKLFPTRAVSEAMSVYHCCCDTGYPEVIWGGSWQHSISCHI